MAASMGMTPLQLLKEAGFGISLAQTRENCWNVYQKWLARQADTPKSKSHGTLISQRPLIPPFQVSREEFSAYAKERYDEIDVDERAELVEEWTLDLKTSRTDPNGEDDERDQDSENQRCGRELELVKRQFKNMVRLCPSHTLLPFLSLVSGQSDQPLYRPRGCLSGCFQKPSGAGPRILHILVRRIPRDM